MGRPLKFLGFAALALAATHYILPVAAQSLATPSIRPAMPDFRFSDASGIPIHLYGFEGRVVVVNFWATWCGPCIQEMVYLDRLQGDMKGQPVVVAPISEDRGGIPVAKDFLTRQKLTYLRPFADPGGQAATALGVQGLPTSWVIDKHDRIASQISGPAEWDNPKILAQFYALAAEK